MSKEFSIRDTNICKGIAIVFMVLHHWVGRYYNSVDLSWYKQTVLDVFGTDNIPLAFSTLFLSTAGKVCVSLLTILSGYGISKKYITQNKTNIQYDIRFVLSRLMKFYSTYIPVFLSIFIYKLVFHWGSFENAILYYCHNDYNIYNFILYLLIDIFGLYSLTKTRSIIQTWYVFAVIVFYIIFPVLFKLIQKYRIPFVMICFLPWVIIMFFGGTKPDSFYGYLSDFSIGIYFAISGILDKAKENISLKNQCISLIFLLLSFGLRLIFSLPMDTLFAISIIIFEIECLSNNEFIGRLLNELGMNSANIWLLHCLVEFSFIQNMYISFVVKFIFYYLLSKIIEIAKEKSRWNNLIKIYSNKIIYC